ncbi:MAG TPA: SLBB domain-containing protein [Chitinophagaceae bacterium]|nr:SLBB domain-containing protein [Chitinophagaceae bacterium]
MKLIIRAFAAVIIVCTCFTKVHAQVNLFSQSDLSNVNIDNYSDEDIAAMYKKATEAGLTESQILKLAADKGLPGSEVEKLQERLETLNLAPRNNSGNLVVDTSKLNNTTNNIDTTQPVPVQKIQKDLSIFGSELFTSNALVFEPNLHIPAPAGYILGPDDEILVSVYGFSEKSYDLIVDQQGEIYIPNVGPVLVNGLTLEQATEKIKTKLASTIYKAINSGRTKVEVTLGKIKSIRVSVIGQAEKPGTFTVSSLTTVYNILYLCGGPTDWGSYRNIEVVRNNQLKERVDLYDFLMNGDKKDDILLHEGDVIRIPYYKSRVEIDGQVKRQGKFEMLDSETFSDLLKYSGGFTDTAYRGRVTVVRITDSIKKIIDLPSSQYNSFEPQGSDQFIVRKLFDDFGNRLVIQGAVKMPGAYELTPGITLHDLIEKAGGLKQDAYRNEVSIFRSLSDKTPSILLINLDSVMDYSQNIYLNKDDSVYIHSVFDFTNQNVVTVEGNVRKPGSVEWRQNISLHDVLLAVGGITETGDSTNIEISRRIRNANISLSNHTESEIIHMDLKSSDDDNIYLKPYDLIIVKTMPGYIKQRTVLLLGEVKISGRYSLEHSRDKISDLIRRAGGFKASADSSSITIRRSAKSNLTVQEREALFRRILNINEDSLLEDPKLKDELYSSYNLISVNLKRALSNPESSDNLVLEEGDVLTVGRSSNLVKISGEVYFPTIVAYEPNKNLKYYVEQAGNFTPYARKKGALVIYPDGRTASVKHFLWFKSYPSVTPRSEVYVPQKNESNRSKLTVAEMALIVSALGIIANVLKL